MKTKVTICDLNSSESRSKFFDFTDYYELDRLVNEFEAETKFAKVDVSIEAAGDEELDQESIDRIEQGIFRSSTIR